MICWRGVRVLKLVAPLVLTASSSQLLPPVKGPEPKSMVVVNRPFLTAVALFVTGGATSTPVTLVANKRNARS